MVRFLHGRNLRSIPAILKTIGLGLVLQLTSTNLSAQTFYGLTGSTLFSFDAATPGVTNSIGAITGVTGGQNIVGMDFRPLNGDLFILGYEAPNGMAQLYTVNITTGAATAVGGTIQLANNMNDIGMDFNPTVDRIRVTDADNNNYRLNPNNGTLAFTDGNLTYALTDMNNGNDPQIVASAYTNSYIGSTTTTLFNYDSFYNILTSQNPPNNGTLNTIGSSGIAVGGSDETYDMDVQYNTVTGVNTAYLLASNFAATASDLYTVNLANGAATLVGQIGIGGTIKDISAQIIVNTPPNISGQLVYGLTSNSYLISFDSQTPATIRSHKSISGVTIGQTLVGLDSRPATGQLYSLGYNATNGEAQLYTINAATGAATSVAAAATLATGLTQVSFDFNPTVDRIRVMSSNGNNYRLHPVTGAIAATDGPLAYAGTDANAASTPAIVGGAYTNSYIGSTSTMLINYDLTLNNITLQNPPNNGTQNTLGTSGIALNTTDPTADVDFFYNTLMGQNENYLAANPMGTTFDNLYTLNITNGASTLIGKIGYGTAVTDIAVKITPNIPAQIAGQLIYGVTLNQYLITFDSQAPSVVRSHTAITGIPATQVIAGLDVRPATGELYALGYNTMNGEAQLYTIAPATGVATSIAPAVTLAPAMGNIGMDFNPTVDRIRVVSASGKNYRLHPTTGAIAATDADLAYAAGDANAGATPSVATSSYTNSFGGSNNTVLFDYDDALNILVKQTPPNNGTLVTVGSSGITQSTTDVTSDMDIFYNHLSHTNKAFFISNATANDGLYIIETATGVASLIGTIGNGIAVRDIAVKNDSITTISSTTSTISPVACETYFAPDNMQYTTSGMYQAIIPNDAGYDSLIVINLTVNQRVAPTFTSIANLCIGATAPILAGTSTNSIDGTWMPATVSTAAAGTTVYTFTPAMDECSQTATLSVTVTDCLGLNDNQKAVFSMYPNPTTSLIYIIAADIQNSDIQITDAAGKVVGTQAINGTQATIDLTNFSNGIYYIKIGSQIERVIRN